MDLRERYAIMVELLRRANSSGRPNARAVAEVGVDQFFAEVERVLATPLPVKRDG